MVLNENKQNLKVGYPVLCEECNQELLTTYDISNTYQLVMLVRKAGACAKTFFLYGDESGFHYFCSEDHAKAWRVKNILPRTKQNTYKVKSKNSLLARATSCISKFLTYKFNE